VKAHERLAPLVICFCLAQAPNQSHAPFHLNLASVAAFPIWRYVDKSPCDIHEATLMFSTRVSNIWKALKDNGFTLSTYIEKVLESPDGALEERESLISNAQPICAALCSIDASGVLGMKY